jgi:uncharacterized protein (AIM24 family)
VCAAATCADVIKNGDEADVDCGGTCPPCDDGKACVVNADCASGTCTAKACTKRFQWGAGYGKTGNVTLGAIAVDPNGNLLVTGSFDGSVDFGGGPLTSAGNGDVFVAKFNGFGDHLWSKKFGDDKNQNGWAIATDSAGDVLLTGYCQGTIDFGGGQRTCGASLAVFIAKLDSTGGHLWSNAFGTGAFGRAVAASGTDMVVAGTVSASVNFGGNTIPGNAGGSGMFVVKLGPNGEHVWSTGFTGAGGTIVKGIAVDGAADVVLTGGVNATVNFGGGALTAQGSGSGFVAKVDSSGKHLWSKAFGDGSTAAAFGTGVAVATSSDILITGAFGGSMDLGGGKLVSEGLGADVFVARLDPNGGQVWSKRFGGAAGDHVGLGIAGQGYAVVTGKFGGSIDFGGGPLTSAGGNDAFVVKLDPNGSPLWTARMGDAADQVGAGAAVGTISSFVAGTFAGSVDFGAGAISCAAVTCVYLAQLAP